MTKMNQTAILAALVAALQIADKKVAKKNAKKADNAKQKLTKDEFETALVAAAKKAGYANPEPRFNILTFDKWMEKGRRVRRGEKALKVQGRKTRLFHEAQTDAVAGNEAAAQ